MWWADWWHKGASWPGRRTTIAGSWPGWRGSWVNMIVLWNILYTEIALNRLHAQGYPLSDADVVRLSPLLHDHINTLGRSSFSVPEAAAKGEVRPLRDRAEE